MTHRDILASRSSAQPPLAVEVSPPTKEDPQTIVSEPVDQAPQSVAGFICVIEYDGEARLITGRRYDVIGERSYVGAICLMAGGYRQFRCDRISAVIDAESGEILGDGCYFEAFAVNSRKDKEPSWGLTPKRKHVLVSGLNVLSFMAQCDGFWHPLETGSIESFVCSLWLRKEWPGDPPMEEIVAHARRLAPDGEVFYRSLKPFAHSRTSGTVLKRAVAELIQADGVICSDEINWSCELEDALRELETSEMRSADAIGRLRDEGYIN